MQSEKQARKKKAYLTPYIRPAVSFVATEKPEWLRAREEAGRGRPRFDSAKMDSFVSGTPANIIAQQFADQQTAASDAKREKERGLRQHERCSTFWEAAHAGVFQSFCQCLVFHLFFFTFVNACTLFHVSLYFISRTHAFPCVSLGNLIPHASKLTHAHACFSMCLTR